LNSSLLNAALENQLLAVLALLSFVLLIVVTLGVGYLTAVEWRDRRRRDTQAAVLPDFRRKGKEPGFKSQTSKARKQK
jgi:hypothetical protein